MRIIQSAVGENSLSSVQAKEIRQNSVVRLTIAARRLKRVIAKNGVYASYTWVSDIQKAFNSPVLENRVVER